MVKESRGPVLLLNPSGDPAGDADRNHYTDVRNAGIYVGDEDPAQILAAWIHDSRGSA